MALPALRYQCVAMFLQPVIIVTNMMFQSIGKSGRATFLACCRQGVCFIRDSLGKAYNVNPEKLNKE